MREKRNRESGDAVGPAPAGPGSDFAMERFGDRREVDRFHGWSSMVPR